MPRFVSKVELLEQLLAFFRESSQDRGTEPWEVVGLVAKGGREVWMRLSGVAIREGEVSRIRSDEAGLVPLPGWLIRHPGGIVLDKQGVGNAVPVVMERRSLLQRALD